jgi:hypothetical protein
VPISSDSKKARSLTVAPQLDPAEPAPKSFPGIAGGIEPLPDKHDVARRCDVSVRTIDRWVVQRKIPFLLLGPRIIRFRWADVERAINRMAVREVK